VLVVSQLAVAKMLLVGAGLLINSFSGLSRVGPCWNPSGVLTFYLVMPQDYSTARKAELIERLINELRTQPRVQSAGFTYEPRPIVTVKIAGFTYERPVEGH
jgi:hypothetical protein